MTSSDDLDPLRNLSCDCSSSLDDDLSVEILQAAAPPDGQNLFLRRESSFLE